MKSLLDEQLDFQERLIRMVLLLAFAAAVIGAGKALLGKDSAVLEALVPLCAVSALSLHVAVKYRKIRFASWLLIVASNVIFFPMIFIRGGGIDSGTPIWFVLGLSYIFLLFRGRDFWKALLLSLGSFLGTYLLAYFRPEILPEVERSYSFTDSYITLIYVSCFVGIMHKVQTKTYDREKQLAEKQKEEIEQIARSKDVFFANMSHEIRTPINTIIGLNEMTLREDISEEIAENAINIQNASKMLLTTINDILDLSKLESGKMDIVPTQYAISSMFSDLVNLIWIRAHQKNLEFKVDIDPEIPSMLYGDEVRIKQVVTNMLTNAVKYTSSGSVTLSAKGERVAADQILLRISVQDTGMGIRKESLDDLFSSFKRVDESDNRHIEGTGLGLNISRQLVEMMGGTITAKSTVGVGSTFTVTLRLRTQPNPLQTVIDTDLILNQIMQHKILVVDDNEMNLVVVKKLLSETKIQIDTALSAAECLKLTQILHYDCILMDHLMPEMDGIQCFHEIQTQAGGLCKDVPVIALTANAGSDNQLLYRKEGFAGYLAKPVSGTLLEAAVLSILPKELVNLSEEAEQSEVGKDILIFEQVKRISLLVTTDSVCDLPESLKKEFNISVCPYYVCTDRGRFLDDVEIMADELLYHMSAGRNGASQPPEVEDYERFFADKLTEAQNVLHITMAKHVSKGYHHALEAAKSFENVTVIDSGHLSSSMGMMVLYAAYMAEHHASKEEIISTMSRLRNYISSAFIIDSTHMMCQAGRISKRTQVMCDALLMHPVIVLRKSRMVVGTVEVGDFTRVAKKYIRKVLNDTRNIDRRILFITYAGMDEKKLDYIQYLVRQYCHFVSGTAVLSLRAGLSAEGVLCYREQLRAGNLWTFVHEEK